MQVPVLRPERRHDKKPKTDGDYRTPWQRDRDRVLYSSSFRRLAEVTQVDLTAATLAAILKYPWLRNGNPDKPRKWGAYESERKDFEFASQLLPGPNERTIEAELLKELTWTYVIEASSLAGQQHGQERVIKDLYEIYFSAAEKPESWAIFPAYYRERLQDNANDPAEKFRISVDLIASMTESQAIAMHHRLTGHSHGSGLDDIVS